MSQVKINFKEKKQVDYAQLKVPVYVLVSSSLYQLIDCDGKIRLLSTNGYVQATGEWNTIEDYFSEFPNHEIVDMELNVTKR